MSNYLGFEPIDCSVCWRSVMNMVRVSKRTLPKPSNGFVKQPNKGMQMLRLH